MNKAILHVPGVPGVYTVTSSGRPIKIENILGALVLAMPDRKFNELNNYTEVDKYRLHPVSESDMRVIKRTMKLAGFTVRKVSSDKLPACWREL